MNLPKPVKRARVYSAVLGGIVVLSAPGTLLADFDDWVAANPEPVHQPLTRATCDSCAPGNADKSDPAKSTAAKNASNSSRPRATGTHGTSDSPWKETCR